MNPHFFKKTAVAIAASVFVVSGAFARTLTPDEALSRALNTNSTKMLRSINKNSYTLEYTAEAEGFTGAYVFSGPSSFIIAGADDKAAPILGYSDECTTDEMPPQLVWWLDQYTQEIKSAREYVGIPGTVNARPERAPIAEMLQTRWNQDSPYNDYAPVVNGVRCPSGCVATAATQIMKYHAWPPQGKGSISYTNNGVELSMDLNIPFEWDNMLNVYSQGAYTTAQGNAVATIMKAFAYTVYMDYSPSGSGAQSAQVPVALKTYFDYDQTARHLDRSYYGLAEWEEIIYNELVANRPVYYSGADMSAGHAFVCDGYQGDGYFHFNWGWGGAYNGYFMLTGLKPDGQGIGGNAGGFNLWQAIVIGIQKNTGVPYEAPVSMGIWGNVTSTIDGDYLGIFAAAYNYTGRTLPIFDQGVCIKEQDSDAEPEYIVSWTLPEPLANNYGYNFQSWVDLNTLDKNKKYEVSFALRLEGTTEWIPFTHPLATIPYVLAYYEDGQWKSQDFTTAMPTVENYKFAGIPQTGQKFTVDCTLINEEPVEVATGVTAQLLKEENGQLKEVVTSDICFIDLEPGEDFTFNVTSNNTLPEAGKYYFAIVAMPSGQIIGKFEYAICSFTPSSVNCSSFTLEGDNDQAELNNLTFKLELTASPIAFTNPITLTFYNVTSNDELRLVTTRVIDNINLAPNAPQTLTETFDLTGAPEGEYLVEVSTVDRAGLHTLKGLTFHTKTSGIAAVQKAGLVSYDRASSVLTAENSTTIEVYSISGQLVAGGRGTIDLSALQNGVYIVRATGEGDNIVNIKIVK